MLDTRAFLTTFKFPIQEFSEIEIDIDPPSLVSRIISVREQIAIEWKDDLETLYLTNDVILDSCTDGLVSSRNVTACKKNKTKALLFDRNAMMVLATSSSSFNRASSPMRRSNLDLLVLLSTQESIHRVLRLNETTASKDDVSMEWLREFYDERVAEYFDGYQRFGRADAFLEELLSTPPRFVRTDEKMHLVDPMQLVEEILRERGEVAKQWREQISDTQVDHVRLRRDILTRQMTVREDMDAKSSSKGTKDDEGTSIFAKALSQMILDGEAFE